MRPRLESTRRLLRRWLTSIAFLALVGVVLGAVIAPLLISKPNVAVITISGIVTHQEYVDDVLAMLQYAREDHNIRAVVLRIDSPGGSASATEEIFLDVLRTRQLKPVVASIGSIGASGGYYVATAANVIYAEPSSQIGSIGVWSRLPLPEELDEDILTSGPFKATGFSRQKAVAHLEMVRQGFVEAVRLQRGDRLKLTEEELSTAEIYLGIDAFRFGLIDGIDTMTAAIEEAATLAGLRHYELVELVVGNPPPVNLEALRSQTGLAPVYYFLHFEQE